MYSALAAQLECALASPAFELWVLSALNRGRGRALFFTGRIMEFISSFLTSARSRLHNPFVGSFIISWLLWNWEIVLIIVDGSLSSLEKIGELHLNYSNYMFLLVGPALSSLALSFLLPMLNQLAERFFFNIVEARRLEARQELTLEKVKLEKMDTDHKEYSELKIGYERARASLDKASEVLKKEKRAHAAELDQTKEQLQLRDNLLDHLSKTLGHAAEMIIEVTQIVNDWEDGSSTNATQLLERLDMNTRQARAVIADPLGIDPSSVRPEHTGLPLEKYKKKMEESDAKEKKVHTKK